ncbi:pyridoxal phosphate-dependent aminotransferase, partial [Desulfovibrio sp. OttesenSCG-928-O18]|nr:pyridoxal phosphate-dependent aminotransferase [Desulfovibrio sp. OttesenSCG-928-O18]
MESIIAQRIPYSKIRVFADAAQRLEEQGQKVIHLEIGRPDFATPENIVNAAIDALKAGKVHYAPNPGIPELRKAIAKRYAERDGCDYDPLKQVLVTNGVAEGIYLAFAALLNPGDQILIPDPGWINYEVLPIMNLAEPLTYSLRRENDFLPDLAEIEEKITSRTKAILVANPSNPTGMVFPEKMLRAIADLAEKHNLVIISDEIYEDLVYPPTQFVSMASFADIRDRLIVLSGLSKTYSMTGWRVGYALGNAKIINAMLRLHQYTITSTVSFAQWGALEALEGTQEPRLAMYREFEKRKDFVYEAINSIPHLSCAKPQGAFYL